MTFDLRSSSDHLGIFFALAVLAGLFVGSFLNVVAYRTPRHLSISKPRSFCPTCQRQLAAWENVPIVSWVALRGRCRTCGEPISARYPMVEAGTAVCFGLVTLAWHGTAPSIGYCVLSATVLAVLLIDAGSLRAPLAVAAVGTSIGDACLVGGCIWDHDWSTMWGAQIGLLAGTVGFAVLRRYDPECVRPNGFGRSALLPAGCWLGGLGALSAALGFGAAGLTFMACLSIARLARHPVDGARSEETPPAGGAVQHHLLRRPLIVAIAVGCTIGLLAFR